VNRSTQSQVRRRLSAITVAVALTAPFLASTASTASTASAAVAKAGARCTKVGQKSGTLVCSKKASRLVWAKAATVTVPGTTKAGSPTTVAKAATAASVVGIEGEWKATSASVVGYRVKEVLNGQSTEGVGRTNAVSGKLTIAATKATAVDLTVDVTKFESDNSNRDRQVQGRILETAKFPTAKLVLATPIEFGKVPNDKEVLNVKAKVTLTIKGLSKDVEVDLKTRRNGPTIEIDGSITLVWADWGVPNPSLAPFVETEDKGLLEFLIVFGR
jgi:polyisoprenoid-binding protein YceI